MLNTFKNLIIYHVTSVKWRAVQVEGYGWVRMTRVFNSVQAQRIYKTAQMLLKDHLRS